MAEVLIAGPELRWQFAAAERKAHFRALVLILPLLLFVLVTFAAPVVLLLMRAVYDPSIAGTLPETVSSLRNWDGKTAPDKSVYAALVKDFKNVSQDNTAAFVGKRLNYEIPGVRSKIIASVAKAAQMTFPPYKEQMIEANKIWGDQLIWQDQAGGETFHGLLSAPITRFGAHGRRQYSPCGEIPGCLRQCSL